MAYPRFAAIIPMGQAIDLAIAQGRLDDAVAMLKDAERDLTLRRRRRGERVNSRQTGSQQRKIDEAAMKVLNKKIDLICATLRGKNPMIRKATMASKVVRKSQARRRR